MPYDPITGEWKEEDTGVAKRMTGMLSKDTEYMQQAGTRGRQAANRRGLLNTSMAVGAVEGERIKAALPIASQEAGQAHERNLQGRGIQFQDISEKRTIGAQREFQATDIEAQSARLESELGSREALQTAQLAAQKERLGEQLTSQEKLALQDLRAAEQRLGMSIEAQKGMQQADIASREGMQAAELDALAERQGVSIASQEFMQGLDLQTRRDMQGLDIESQERIAQMNVAASERNAAAAMAVAVERNYTDMMATIMNNPDIPAGDRQTYFDHANRTRESGIALIEQLYNIDLDWAPATSPTAPPPPGGNPLEPPITP